MDQRWWTFTESTTEPEAPSAMSCISRGLRPHTCCLSVEASAFAPCVVLSPAILTTTITFPTSQ